jgi:TatA/E family protein of Tat protein translocase
MNLDKTLIIVLVLVLVVMGPSQLPKIAQALGKSAKALKDGMDGKHDDQEGPAAATKAAKDESPKE